MLCTVKRTHDEGGHERMEGGGVASILKARRKEEGETMIVRTPESV